MSNWHRAAERAGVDLAESVAGLLTTRTTASLPGPWRGDYSVERARRWIAERDAESQTLLVTDHRTGAVVGLVLLFVEASSEDGNDDLRIGYLLSDAVWGQGLGSELVAGLVRWAKASPGLSTVTAGVEASNVASARVLVKNGFARVGPGSDGGLVYRLDVASAARIAAAESGVVYEHLGVQMNRDSTLVSSVEKLIWLLTGNFARPGAQYVPSNLSSIGRDRGLPFDAIPRSPVVGAPIISGLVPCNVIAEEILADHPARYRALIVESSNPRALIGRLGPDACGARCPPTACGHRRRHGRDRQTGRLRPAGPDPVREVRSHVLQLRLPSQHHHLRHPVLPTPAGMLAEPELHARLVEASGALSEADYAPLRDAAAQGRAAFAAAFLPLMADPSTRRLAPILPYRTLGPTLPEGAAGAAVLWAAATKWPPATPQA